MASYNRVVLLGNLTRDPELRYIPSGTAVSEIGLAVNDRVKKNDQWVDETTFVDITLWGRTAEVANEYLSKGSSILIEGRLKLDTWEKEGQKRSKLRVVADKMQMLGGRSANDVNSGGNSRGGEQSGSHVGDSQQGYGASQGNANRADTGQASPDLSGPSKSGAASPSMPPADEIPF
jgi:single-strand DNA-binding protein